MASRRSILPPKAQIPVALVLAVFFAVLLWMRFAPDSGQAARKEVVVSQATYSLDELRRLIEDVKREDLFPPSLDPNLPECEDDPFLWDALKPVEPIVALPGELDTAADDALEERNERLAELQLSGTMFVGRKGIAIINGKQFQSGDEVAGFTVNHINERSAVLIDEYGAEELEIVFESLLPYTEETKAGS